MTTRDVIPSAWTALLQGGPLTWGLDLATTEKAKSNPSSMVVMERWQGLFIERLVVEWKTSDENVTTAVVRHMLEDVKSVGRRFRCGCIDSTNETFFAQKLQKDFRTHCTIHLVKGGEKLTHKLQEFDSKTLLGSLFVNAHVDGTIATPSASWIKDDRRLVKRNKGRFECDLGREGQHGDTFDGGKLALWGQIRKGGPVVAQGVGISEGFTLPQRPQRPGLRAGIDDTHEYGTAKLNL